MISERHLKKSSYVSYEPTPEEIYDSEQFDRAGALQEYIEYTHHKTFENEDAFCEYVISHWTELNKFEMPYDSIDAFRNAIMNKKFKFLFTSEFMASDEEIAQWKADYLAGKVSI